MLSPQEQETISSSAQRLLEWDKDARERVARIPAGFMREMTRRRIEHWARKFGHDRVTVQVVEAKYKSWAAGSGAQSQELAWRPEAEARAARIPDFIRPMVMKEIERNARARGKNFVDEETIDQVLRDWSGRAESFHSREPGQ